jgi:hypothetical protein
MQCELKTITPETAKELLSLNVKNRAVNRMHVDSLAKEMKNGRWKVNGDTICLNGSRLIDGQHRLHAVVASGVTIQSFVVTDLPSDVFDTKDVGKRRSPGDTLSVLGYTHSHRLAAQLALIDAYCTSRADKQVHYSNTEVESLLVKYPNAADSIQTKLSGKSLVPPSVLDACHYLFSQKDKELADDFVDKVLKGAGLEEQSAWYVLRERLVANSLSKSKLSRPYIMALCIKAWNVTRAGKTIRYLRWREKGDAIEPYPVVQ